MLRARRIPRRRSLIYVKLDDVKGEVVNILAGFQTRNEDYRLPFAQAGFSRWTGGRDEEAEARVALEDC